MQQIRNWVISHVLLVLLFYLPNLLWATCNLRPAGGEQLAEALVSAIVVTGPFFAAACGLLWCLPRTAALVVTAVAFAQSLMAIVAIGHFSIYGHGITPSTFYVALSSNLSEAMNYGQMYFGKRLFLPIFLLVVAESVIALLFLRAAAATRYRFRPTAYLVISGLLAIPFLPIIPERHKMFDLTVAAYRLYTFDVTKMKVMHSRRQNAREGLSVKRIREVGNKETYVLVIGESASRSHMGLYGYFRETTPKLSSMRTELVLFNDVASADFCTYLSLRKMLTFANYQDMKPLYDYNLMDIMKQAGFTTYWIANQKSHGNGDIWSKYFSESADMRVYLNTAELTDPLDEVLLPPFQKILEDKTEKKFIVVHMMGSHMSAANRYPAEFRNFTSVRQTSAYFAKRSSNTREYINHYDNSMLYTDSVLSRLITFLKATEGENALLFLSDHGDQLGEQDDFVGRSYRTNRYQFEIPFFVWMSPEYESRRKDFSDRIRGYGGRRYQSDDLIHCVLDLVSVESSSFKPERSIFNAAFREKKRHMEIPLEPEIDLLPVVVKQ